MVSELVEDMSRLPRKRMGAGALFVDERDRVLLVEPTYQDYWELLDLTGCGRAYRVARPLVPAR